MSAVDALVKARAKAKAKAKANAETQQHEDNTHQMEADGRTQKKMKKEDRGSNGKRKGKRHTQSQS